LQSHDRLTQYLYHEPLKRIQVALGRPLRVLYLGNVANYAYVNASLMRSVGVEADVLDPDFYHIMATPEWQDVDFQANFPDQFKPTWKGVDTKNYKRPTWFVQGPLLPALRHLIQIQVARSPLMAWAARFDLALSTKRDLDAFSGPLSRFVLASAHPLARAIRAPVTLVQRWARWITTPQLDTPPQLACDFPLSSAMDDTARSLTASAFSHYDIIHSYTISGHLAAQAGHQRYIACELGTLRGLPFEDSPMGHLTAWLYRDAPEVMITNPDCLAAAKRLGIAEARITPVLHPYDIQAAEAVLGKSFAPPQNAGPPLFFAPARHHWSEGNASWLKGNHIYLQALGKLLVEGHDFQLVTVNWGMETAQSRALIEQLGLTSRTTWIEPAPRQALWRWYQKSAAVLDQFNAECFGGAGLDAMVVGRRLITRFDAQAVKPFFEIPPPLQNAETVDDVLRATREIVLDPTDKAQKGAELYHWVRAHHGLDRQLTDQFDVYQRLLDLHA
jgi:hypothetical protein